MVVTVGISGFKPADSFLISVSQGAITAGPISVPAWGQPNTGGTITIQTDRTDLQCAPDSVRFTVDLSASDFDTAGPTVGGIYDPRLHELIYLWDFDDAASGNWTAPVNVLPAWKDRNVAKGPFVAHMYTQPGTYNPSVLVIEPSSGKTATASISVTVADPDVVFAGAKTICVSTSGNFAGAPAGAELVTATGLDGTTAPWTTYASTTEPRRWLLCRGETFTLYMSSNALRKISFGAYGTGDRPRINPASAALDSFTIRNWYTGTKPDVRFYDWDVRGTYDPSVYGASGPFPDTFLSFGFEADLMLHNVHMSGFKNTTILFQPSTQSNENSRIHLDDCTMTDLGGQYPLFFGSQPSNNSCNVLTGTRVIQNPNAKDGNNAYGSLLRSQGPALTHMRGCDFFHLDSSQRCAKLIETPRTDGPIVNVHSCSFEGGLTAFSLQGNPNDASNTIQRSIIANAIIDGVIAVGTYSNQQIFHSNASGWTMRNCLFIQPAVPWVGWGLKFFVNTGRSNVLPDPVYGQGPIRMYNNTARMDRTTIQMGATTGPIVFWEDTSGGFMSDVQEYNNIVHVPNLDDPNKQVEFAPLSDTVLWTPRCIGYKATDTLDPTYATPTDAVKDTRPLAGSAALGAALTGDVSYMDILGTTRTAPADKGAWKAA